MEVPVKENIATTQSNGVNHLFPVFLKLETLRVLVVGGGKVGLEKLTAIIHNSPKTQVRLVALEISEAVQDFSITRSNIELVEKPFDAGDLDGIDLVVAAVDDPETSLQIRNAAKEVGKLVNVADKPELCDFYLGSVVQKGDLKIAISTNGKSPTTAKRLREVLHEALPAELTSVIDNLHKIRTRLNGNFESKVKKLNKITSVLVEKDSFDKEVRWRKVATYSLIGFALMLIGHFIFSYLPFQQIADDTVKWYQTLDKKLPLDGDCRIPRATRGWRARNGVWSNQCNYS